MGIATRNLVHDSFLQWLHNEREHARIYNYKFYSDYYNGEQDVDIPEKVKAALESELGTVMNYCRLIVNTSVDYIAGGDITVEVKDDLAAEEFLNDIYDENDLLTMEMMKLVTIMGKKGDVFTKLFIEDNQIKINVLRPQICFPRYKTDDYKKMIYCAIQWWEDEDKYDKTEVGKWHAQVFRPDRVDEYELESDKESNIESQRTNWQLVDSKKNVLGFIPIIHFKNTVDDLEFGVSDLQVMTDLQDALNKTITDMLMVMDTQAFQRVWVFGSTSPKGVEVSVAPGMVTEVPDATGHLSIIEPAAVEPFVVAMSSIIDHIMTITSTSKVQIMKPDAPLPPSGFALRMHYIPTERKADKKLAVMQSGFRNLNGMILKAAKILNQGDFGDPLPKTRIHFDLGLPIDELSKMQTDEGKIRMGTKSPWTVMEEDGVEDIPLEMERIDAHLDKLKQREIEIEIEVAKATEALRAAARPPQRSA